MHGCFRLLTLILVVVLRAAAQSLPIIITPPETIIECKKTVFTWSGGDPPYSFYYGPGHEGFGNDHGVETEYLVQDGIIAPAVTFYVPYSDGLPWRFRVADGTQSASAWMYIQASGSCFPTFSTIPPPFTTTQAAYTSTTQIIFTTGISTFTSPPFETYTTAPISITTSHGPPGSTGPGPTSTIVISITTKQTNLPPNPTANPSDPNPDPDAPPGSDVSPGNTSLGSGGTGGPADGSASSGNTRPTSNQPTDSHGGTNGGNPTQTASPIRNTQSGDDTPVPMSTQTRGAIIGTLTGAFMLFITFLCFRWRRRHRKKHRPVPILPRVGNSDEDITTAAVPPYEYSPPMRTNEHLPVRILASQPRPAPSPPRVLPGSKQAVIVAPPRSSSDFGSEVSSPTSADTWQLERDEMSRAGSASTYPEDEMSPPPLGHSPVTNNSHERSLRQTVPSSMPSPLSLRQLIGRELDNILSSPDNYSPDTPAYTPTSTSTQDYAGRFRVANDTEQSSTSAGAVGSTSKHAYALTGGSNSQKGEHTRRFPELGPTDSRGGAERQRVPISRHEMEYLADLVAARITRDSNQRTGQIRSEMGRHGPPPSYI